MPPPQGTVDNFLEGPADYTFTPHIHSDTYEGISPLQHDLTSRTVLVTGASRGFGRATAVSFARAGASNIVLFARTDLSESIAAIKSAAEEAGRAEPRVLPLQVDVSDSASVASAAQTVKEKLGTLDVLVNNAGHALFERIVDADPEAWVRVFDVNVFGPMRVIKAFIPLMLASEASLKTVITVSSVGALLTTPAASAYQISKTAALRLMDFASKEHGDQGLVAVTVHPGNSLTSMTDGTVSDAMRPIFVDTPELCADSIVYLASKNRAWLGGRYVNVTWDMPELMEKKKEIVEKDLLRLRLAVE